MHVQICSNTNRDHMYFVNTSNIVHKKMIYDGMRIHVCVRGNRIRIFVRYIAAPDPTMQVNTYTSFLKNADVYYASNV